MTRSTTSQRLRAVAPAKVAVKAATRAKLDALIASMQTPEARAAMQVAFSATPAQLGEAAVRGARARRGRR